eukprot:359458-Chlamydomonas_euryale.AAC.2
MIGLVGAEQSGHRLRQWQRPGDVHRIGSLCTSRAGVPSWCARQAGPAVQECRVGAHGRQALQCRCLTGHQNSAAVSVAVAASVASPFRPPACCLCSCLCGFPLPAPCLLPVVSPCRLRGYLRGCLPAHQPPPVSQCYRKRHMALHIFLT